MFVHNYYKISEKLLAYLLEEYSPIIGSDSRNKFGPMHQLD